MQRIDIANKIGTKYIAGNVENNEFNYQQAFTNIGKNFYDYQPDGKKVHTQIDLRFTTDDHRLAVLIETKDSFNNSKWKKTDIEAQLQAYVNDEKILYPDEKIVAILAETKGDGVRTWYGDSVIINDKTEKKNVNKILSFKDYEELYYGKVNNRNKIIDAIKQLNEMLNSDGINEHLRSQFVGTCLLALKEGLTYKGIKPLYAGTKDEISPQKQLINSISAILDKLLSNNDKVIEKATKIGIIKHHVLTDQDITTLSYSEFVDILQFIENNIMRYINDTNIAGQDLLNLFFTTFNKYVGKSDKNQAFTPDHICDFMSKAIDINAHSRILDPCCGSGSFLVRSMVNAMDACDTEKERENVKKNQIYGIEYEDNAYGLATTNMLIHGDGNSNVIKGSMFNKGQWIKNADINAVLMNPPYNATKNFCDPDYVKGRNEYKNWGGWSAKTKSDPSKGFHYVYWIAQHVEPTAKLAVLLPVSAAIGRHKEVRRFKRLMLEHYTLEAVFSLPNDIFYPGANVVACCMIFDLSQPHARANRDTFFGYFKNDNFTKRKSTGRVEKEKDGISLWPATEEKWLNLYRNKREVTGLSVMHKVTWKDEWLAEAYMKTDYSNLKETSFQQTINNYLAFLIKDGDNIK